MKREKPKSRIFEEIDANLKKAFDDVAEEPIPDRFSNLLQKLRDAETAKGDASDNDN